MSIISETGLSETSLEPLKVALIGSTGLLGLNWLMRGAEHKDFEMTAVWHHRDVTFFQGPKYQLRGNSLEYCLRLIEQCQPDLIVNCSAQASVPACENDPDAAFEINAELPARLAAACAQQGVGFAHISTDHLYDNRDLNHFYSEEDAVAPLNVYAKSKYKGECLVQEALPDALVLRTNFFGWGPTYRPSFSDWILSALSKATPIKLYTDVHHTPLYCQTLIKASMDLIAKKASGVFNLSSDSSCTKYDLGLALAQTFDLQQSSISKGCLNDHFTGIERPKNMRLSNAKVCKILGRSLGTWADQVSWLYADMSRPPFAGLKEL